VAHYNGGGGGLQTGSGDGGDGGGGDAETVSGDGGGGVAVVSGSLRMMAMMAMWRGGVMVAPWWRADCGSLAAWWWRHWWSADDWR